MTDEMWIDNGTEVDSPGGWIILYHPPVLGDDGIPHMDITGAPPLIIVNDDGALFPTELDADLCTQQYPFDGIFAILPVQTAAFTYSENDDDAAEPH